MIRSLLCLIVVCSLIANGADLPIREVVLYKNGVGYFERAGELRPGESARLDFDGVQMNDILKSLTVRDASGGTVGGVRYDSAEPLEKKLSTFPFRLGAGQPLVQFLDQVKGARIESNLGNGAIVGARIVKAQQGEEKEQLTLMLDDGGLRSMDLAGLTTLKFSDSKVQRQLRDYLAALTVSRSKDKKSVYIDSANDRARSLSMSYVAPTPVWKSSYRLVFHPTGDPTLEGWAIVDNTSGEDWTNARLALVSGRPVSFQSRLYEPRYIQRQFVELAGDQAVSPKLYAPSAGLSERAGVGAGMGGGVGSGGFGGVIGGIVGGAPGAPPPSPANRAADMAVMVSAIPTNTVASQEVGELFEYRFSSPVTVKANESAMLPFVQQKIAARKLLIWTDGLNPRNAAELTNGTGKTLDGGPVTVFDGGAYGGEALVETVKQGEKRLIGYAVDLGTRVSNLEETGSEVIRQIKAERGLLEIRNTFRSTTTYSIHNVDAKAKTLIIEHPLRPESKVIGAPPVETTTTARRFEVALKPSSEQKFAVVEEIGGYRTILVTDLSEDQLAVYFQSKTIPDAARRALEQIMEKKRAIARTEGEIAATNQQIADLEKDQDRLRRNLASLNAIAGQQEPVQRYAKQLSDQETRIMTLRDGQAKLRAQWDTSKNELRSMIEKLTF